MNKRLCQLRLCIDNGTRKWYALRPLAQAELPSQFVCGFRLTGLSETPSPLYDVVVAGDGSVNCTCPQWQRTERCKHADALKAAGVLPCHFVQLVRQKNHQLDRLEAEIAELRKPKRRRAPPAP
jgi:hypothetical protein